MKNAKTPSKLAHRLATFMFDSGREYTLDDVRMLLKSHSIESGEVERQLPSKKPLIEKIMREYRGMRKLARYYEPRR